jgi:hypothetical protein
VEGQVECWERDAFRFGLRVDFCSVVEAAVDGFRAGLLSFFRSLQGEKVCSILRASLQMARWAEVFFESCGVIG